jgi:hypothetical protein
MKARYPAISRYYCGHSTNTLTTSLVDTLITGTKEVLMGKTAQDTPTQLPLVHLLKLDPYIREHHIDNAIIVYDMRRITADKSSD